MNLTNAVSLEIALLRFYSSGLVRQNYVNIESSWRSGIPEIAEDIKVKSNREVITDDKFRERLVKCFNRFSDRPSTWRSTSKAGMFRKERFKCCNR